MKKKKEKEKSKNKYYFITTLIVVVVSLCSLLLYARYIGTSGLVVKEYIIRNDRIPASFDGFKIAHFSDLHYGSTVFLPEVEKLVDKINELRPDVIVFTGDLIDSNHQITNEAINNLVNVLNKLNPTITSYLVPGGHDQTAAFAHVVENSNFEPLYNEFTLFYFNGEIPIRFIGISDLFPHTRNYEFLFEEEYDEYFTIVLLHEPDVFDAFSHHRVDLLFSGHSHCGQIRLPFFGPLAKVQGSRMYHEDRYNINGTEIFISCGIGTSQLPFRLFNRPSINLYRFFAE